MGQNQLQERLFKFSVDVIMGVRNLPKGREFQVVSHQILKSATSVGANYEEAQAAVSNADFSNKIAISLKEIRETNYWIRLILAISSKNDVWNSLEKESMELMKILGTIHSKTRKRFNK
ncbi:four helix bundle protein [Marinifilum flexuosum]|uniref:Four helix bundle protein n=2 Tax=Marinifilum flexuosum TaxID=1117708 RepID=A0A419XA00_9BACT|nr:four helix bundle protein [Marinifilum flexuosum]